MTTILKKKGFNVNHKKVLRIMKEESLLCFKFKTRSRKYSSYNGQIGKVASNLVNRRFKASKPNELWLTDITEFRIKGQEKKLYLSSTINLTNTMLDKALDKNKDIKNLTIH